MRVPLLLLVLSLLALAACLLLPPWRDAAFLAVAVALAALVLALHAALRHPAAASRRDWPRDDGATAARPAGPRTPRPARRAAPPPAPRSVPTAETGPLAIIDGSNVMHWNGETPRLETLRDVIAHLRARGFRPGVVFDANAGYKFGTTYLDDRHFARLLDLPGDRVLVVPRGQPADPTILTAARDLDARIVTNDRFRDWQAEFPEIARPGQLVRGGYRDGRLWLDARALAD